MPQRTLKLRGRTIEITRPLVMGVLNATPDSFSDPGEFDGLDSQLERVRQMIEEGADIIDVGGESAVTNRPPVPAQVEIERVCPLIERATSELGATVSVDTYKPQVAGAAIEAGAAIVNDTSGLRDPEVASACARSGSALVIMHTRVEPKRKLEGPVYADVVEDVFTFLGEKMDGARDLGVTEEQIILDPGPDFAKSPAQTVEALRALPKLHELGRPLLLALSRKDFIGAITGTMPRERGAGTLAAFAYGLSCGGHIVRAHDVAAAAQLVDVWSALAGSDEVSDELVLAEELRRESTVGS